MGLKDSGERREFVTGAVRDIADGKGRCDLLPLDVISEWQDDHILFCINRFVRKGGVVNLEYALERFCEKRGWDVPTAILEVAKHFEDGARKYDERNWEKGISLHCYIDSGVRHYLKWRRGDEDEPHDRAFVWNILCAMWTMRHRPEMIDLPFAEEKDNG